MPRKSIIENCLFVNRDGNTKPLFVFQEDGRAWVEMRGYAVIPIEQLPAEMVDKYASTIFPPPDAFKKKNDTR